MPTKNIECQLAQGQIGRYLNGDRFSAEAVTQLEAHIAECEECTALLSERKKAVMAMLGEVASTRAAVQMEVPTPSNTAVAKLVSALVRPADDDEAAPPKPQKLQNALTTLFPKPVLYCGALALVLMGMSYYSKGALKTFGPTAGESLAVDQPAPAPAAHAATTTTPQTTSERAVPNPATARSTPSQPKITPQPARSAPVALKNPAPKATTPAKPPVTKPAARRPVVPSFRVVVHRLARHPRKLRHAWAHKPVRSGVRVYDPQGRPLP